MNKALFVSLPVQPFQDASADAVDYQRIAQYLSFEGCKSEITRVWYVSQAQNTQKEPNYEPDTLAFCILCDKRAVEIGQQRL